MRISRWTLFESHRNASPTARSRRWTFGIFRTATSSTSHAPSMSWSTSTRTSLALGEVRQTLKPGGGLVVSVPQHPWLWSALDEFGRHRRRYGRRGALELIRSTGFEVLRVTSSVTFLLPLVAISRLRNRRMRPDYDPFHEMTVSPLLNRIFAGVMHAERAVTTHGVSMPFGSSLFIVARRA